MRQSFIFPILQKVSPQKGVGMFASRGKLWKYGTCLQVSDSRAINQRQSMFICLTKEYGQDQ